MEVDVKLTAAEFDIIMEGLVAVKERIGNSCGNQDTLNECYESVHQLELRLRDILKGTVAKAMA
jgi:hypothetical protein